MPSSRLPLPWWLALPLTLTIAAVESAAVREHGPLHLLWFSHLGMIAAALALWTGSRLLTSMLAVGVLLPELGWSADFLVGLLIGRSPSGATQYMFRGGIAANALSLFHLLLPPLILALLWRLGYDRRAVFWQSVLAWALLPLAWTAGEAANINWTWGLGESARRFALSPLAWLLSWMLAYPLVVHLPAHAALLRWRSAEQG